MAVTRKPQLIRSTVLWTTRAAFGLALSSVAVAQTATPGANRVDNRQDRQELRIDQGIASGQITQREAQRLDAQQNRVDRMESRALADGSLNARERVRLERAQDVQSRHIARQRRDAQTR